jgi:hypothetical protein
VATLARAATRGLHSLWWWVPRPFGNGALPGFKTAMLYSLDAMTTYGHQNLLLREQWQLLGVIEALNGWLLFGLSTAFLFWMIQEVAPEKNSGR